jgi:hypothetical protein
MQVLAQSNPALPGAFGRALSDAAAGKAEVTGAAALRRSDR